MKLKNINAFFITLILVSCVSIPGQLPTQGIELTSPAASPSPTLTPKPTLVKTPTTTATLTIRQLLAYTPQIIFTPDPTLIQDFAGTYSFIDNNDAPCKLDINSDGTFSIGYFFHGMWDAHLDGNIFFADGRFILISPKRDEDLSPFYCFPQALIPVFWGDRRYLFIVTFIEDESFSASDVTYFCEDIKTGKEPQNSISVHDKFYFLRETDTTAKVTGLPARQDGQLLCQ
jgi:hypothetical protein